MNPGQPAGVLFDDSGVKLNGADRILLERAASLKAPGRTLQVDAIFVRSGAAAAP